ncbi:MAG: LCP family protein [Patescibacteria group bacterium]
MKSKVIVLIVVFIVLVAVAKVIVLGQAFMRVTGLTPVTVVKLLFNGGTQLRELEGRTNILLLGIGGGTHEGSDLTDTMIVLSILPLQHTMAMISLPRDLWSDTLRDKINSAYHYGGFVLAKSTVEDVIGMPIHYAFLVDFSGFQKIIDLVGGVYVNVTTAFTDSEFPVAGRENDLCGGDPTLACRYEAIHFEKGEQLMNGNRALQYVRSRHAEGNEGSDFARSKRQQDVLVALKAKLTDPRVWLSPRLPVLVRALDDATDTDLNISELATVGKLTVQVPGGSIKKISFEDFLITPPSWQYDGKYVLVPKEDGSSIQQFIKAQL